MRGPVSEGSSIGLEVTVSTGRGLEMEGRSTGLGSRGPESDGRTTEVVRGTVLEGTLVALEVLDGRSIGWNTNDKVEASGLDGDALLCLRVMSE